MTLFCGFDIETTGLEIGDHRIIEVYLGLWRGEGAPALEYEQRIDPQRSIAVDAQRVHGISSADLVGKPTWNTVAPKIQAVLAKADYHVAHNGEDFDVPFLEYELKRIGLKFPKRPLIDTMKQGVWATPDGKKPLLKELCFACAIEYDQAKAHAAPYDVRDTMMPAFFKALSWGYFNLPEVEAKQAA